MRNSSAFPATCIDNPIEKVLAALEAAGCRPCPCRGRPGQWTARCPAHDDRNPSLTVGTGDDGRVLICCHRDCSVEDVLAALGLEVADLFPGDSRPAPPRLQLRPREKPAPTPEAAVAGLVRKWGEPSAKYAYCDAQGKPVAAVFRWDVDGGKEIRPVRRVPGGWELGAPEPLRPLYHLAEVEQADVVHVVEGEKCADALASVGLVATTSLGGSNAAHKSDWEPLRGKQVVVWPDNDEAGQQYAQDVAWLCRDAGAAEVRIVDLAAVWKGCPPGGDVADLLSPDAENPPRGDAAEPEQWREWFQEVAAAAPVWEPAAEDGESDAPVQLLLVRGDQLTPKPVRWLWPGRIPQGEATIFAGAPDVGKSTVALDIAARVTRGLSWPDGNHVPGGSVLVLSAEDSPERTLLPRFLAAGGDPRQIHFVQAVDDTLDGQRLFDLARDALVLRQKIEQLGNVLLVIVDPVEAYLPSKADSHKNADVRRALAPMDLLAEETGVAVVYISHWRKNASDRAIYRVSGSIGFTAAARAVWAIDKAPDKTDLRVMARIKCNLAPDDVPSLGFVLREMEVPGHPGLQAPRVEWQGPVDMTAEDLAGPPRQGERGPEPEALRAAMDFLVATLAHGPRSSREIRLLAAQEGLAWATIRRAKDKLGVVAERQAEGWFWRLNISEKT